MSETTPTPTFYRMYGSFASACLLPLETTEFGTPPVQDDDGKWYKTATEVVDGDEFPVREQVFPSKDAAWAYALADLDAEIAQLTALRLAIETARKSGAEVAKAPIL